MFLPYHVDVPMACLPVANWILIAFTCAISTAILLGLWEPRDPRAETELEEAIETLSDEKASPKELADAARNALQHARGSVPPLALRPDNFSLSQLVSHLFVHGGLFHLLGNMFFLFLFGNAVNAKLGHPLFIGLYLLMGALAAGAWLFLGDGRPAVGASGAIMGVVGVFFVLFPRNDVRGFYFFYLLGAGVFTISSAWLILFYLGYDLFGALYNPGAEIGYLAHVVGGFAGIALAVGLVTCGWLTPERGEENLLQVLGFQEEEEPRKVRKRIKALR